MPPQPVSVKVAEFDDDSQHHLVEIGTLPGVVFGTSGQTIPGALLINNPDGSPAGLWLPVPATPIPQPPP